jgi:hypothetical protein
MMNKYNANEVMRWSNDKIWSELPPTKILLEFDDGIIETTGRRTAFAWYMWELHRQFDKTPLSKRHHYGMEMTTGKTHSNIMNNIYWDLIDAYGEAKPNEEAMRLIYVITSTVFNDYIERCDEYVTSISAFDVIGLMAYPPIKELVEAIKPTQKSIDKAYDKFAHIIMTDKNLRHNEIANAIRCGLLSMKQAQQCFVCRGYATEIDSTIYPTPITDGYARGLRKLSDAMKEARTATKSLLYNKYYLSECEYFNRKVQLGASVVKYLYHGDCGTTHTWAWKVEAHEFASLQGMHYHQSNGKLAMITKDSKEIIGKVINLRTPFNCMHADKQTICSTCMGALAKSIPEGRSPGHISAISTCELITQLTLSTKHVDGNANVDEIVIDEYTMDYLINGAQINTIRLAPRLVDYDVELIISADEAKGIPSLNTYDDFDEVRLEDITAMSAVTFVVTSRKDPSDVDVAPVACALGSRLASLTPDMLYYIKENQKRLLSISDMGDYIINLSEWDFGLSIFSLPMKHTNMIDYQMSVSSHLLSGEDSSKMKSPTLSSRQFKDNPIAAVKSLMALINSKLSISASHVLVLAYAMAAVNPRGGDYNLPRGDQSFVFVKYQDLMTFRSLGTKFVFQGQETIMSRPEAYTIQDRPSGLLDEMILG